MKKTIIALSLLICLNFGSIAHAEYVAKQGDTMYKIAQKYNMSLKDLLSLNPHLINPNKINAGDFIVVRSKQTAKDLVDYAKSTQDITAYVYGGNNFPYEVDCSSWTQGVFKKFGVYLPRTSAEQATTGVPVKFSDLQIGDLMFFSTAADKHITHVGIYMGDNYWISNLNSKEKVKILSSWGKWTQEHFMWGTRYKL
jgi:cell wall-associated NlpC family hydrolase